MGLFSILKKINSSFPENEIEKALMLESKDTTSSVFYEKLLWNELIVLTNGNEELGEGSISLEKDTTIHFLTLENGLIPIFTSTNRIFDKKVINNQVPFMTIKGQDLFKFAKGAIFIINPFSDFNKRICPIEIENLLDGY